MSELDPIKNDKGLDKQELIEEKRHEHKYLGTNRRPFRNARLWALDYEKGEVYEVSINSKEAYDPYARKEKGTHKVTINQKHVHVWALNKKNAIKKFMKMKFRVKN